MNNILIAYFSASGVTAKVASELAQATGGELHEIIPCQAYTDADLNWHDSRSRSSLEMKDKASRPAIKGKVENMEQYDLTGKTIIPFATSGSSGMGDTNAHLKPSCPGAILKEGKRFPAGVTVSELKKWAENVR